MLDQQNSPAAAATEYIIYERYIYEFYERFTISRGYPMLPRSTRLAAGAPIKKKVVGQFGYDPAIPRPPDGRV